MARETNAAITFKEAWDMVNLEGYIVKTTFSESPEAMNKEKIENCLHVINTNFNTYEQNRLVPYHLIQPRTTAWRGIDPYCVTDSSVVYYPLTQHNAGNSTYTLGPFISLGSYVGVKYLQRRSADGSIRENTQNIANGAAWKEPSSFILNDVIATTIPINQITEIKMQYSKIKKFFMDFNDIVNLTFLNIRGNYMPLGDLNLSRAFKIDYLNLSRNYLNTLKLPDPTLASNVIKYIDVGDYSNSDLKAPRQVIDEVTRYAYHSNYVGASTSSTKVLSTGANVGNIYINGMNYHYELVNNKGWSVSHISTVESIIHTNVGETFTTPIMCSTFNWTTSTDATWITVTASGTFSNNVQNVSYTIATNSTGIKRTGTLRVHKQKTDGSGEYNHPALITVTQNA